MFVFHFGCGTAPHSNFWGFKFKKTILAFLLFTYIYIVGV